jgi:hypothetical protein
MVFTIFDGQGKLVAFAMRASHGETRPWIEVRDVKLTEEGRRL